MKRMLFFGLFFFATLSLSAQFVFIPDTNFRKYLVAHFPAAMLGNSLDTTHPAITNLSTLQVDSLHIRSLKGVEYFDNLSTLICSYNLLTLLPPKLPAGLKVLECKVNGLDSLPANLPAGLEVLRCSGNKLQFLPALPNSLTELNCAHNLMTVLPVLPSGLLSLYCGANPLGALPALPASLQHLSCYSNQLTVLLPLPPALLTLHCSENALGVLPVLPATLQELVCRADSLTVLPALPAGLKVLTCSSNLLGALPVLPSLLTHLDCSVNPLGSLPALPGSLLHLNCAADQLSALPVLPSGLTFLDCSFNSITQLPVLPPALGMLLVSSNPLAVLPVLPASLWYLKWNSISTQTLLPTLPPALRFLEACNNPFSALPVLPASLEFLACRSDGLTVLPALPSGLLELDCSANPLPVLPALPPTLLRLELAFTPVSSIAAIPSGLQMFNISGDTALNCLPALPRLMRWVQLQGSGITCFPNLIRCTDSMHTSYPVFTMPLCQPASGCPLAWNVAGNVHAMVSSNCAQDSINPGPAVSRLAVNLYKNGVLLDAFIVNGNGEYSFDTGSSDTVEVAVDTLNAPYRTACPVAGFRQVVITPSDSLKGAEHFAVKCQGADASVGLISGRFRPALLSLLQVHAGDDAQRFGVQCTQTGPATVTTVLQGPVSFMQAAPNALQPTSVNGQVITYQVSNLSLLNYQEAFNIHVVTDPSAVIGNEVCVRTRVQLSATDMQPQNNELSVCFPVVNSFDPNAKYVTPKEGNEAGDFVRYLIQFQNTGNDTAYDVVIQDTLHENLDWNSFAFMNSSHPVVVTRIADRVTFMFKGINLLDSVSNEPLSHGWLNFRIRLRSDLPMGAKTPNTAFIYFDGNKPIQTDTAFCFVGADTTFAAGPDPFHVPTAITPNEDGLNDRWRLLNPHYIDRKRVRVESVQVFNRWGQMVFQSASPDFDWVPETGSSTDVYTYRIVYRTVSGAQWLQRGTITAVY